MIIHPILPKLLDIEKELVKDKSPTEHEKGQLYMIRLIKNELKSDKEKYTFDDLKKIPKESRVILSHLMIANELHNLCEVFESRHKV